MFTSGLKILERSKFNPIALCPGDSLVVTHKAKAWFGREKELVKTQVTAEQAMVIDEAVLFETVFENRRAVGGLLLERVE